MKEENANKKQIWSGDQASLIKLTERFTTISVPLYHKHDFKAIVDILKNVPPTFKISKRLTMWLTESNPYQM
jgi:hypothetical protein